jgi:hypothetical protein
MSQGDVRKRPAQAASSSGKVTVISQEATAAERLWRVNALDLKPVVYKLMHPEPGRQT